MSGGTLRIGVDGRAFSSPAGGVRRYVWELYGAILERDPSIQIVAIGARGEVPRGVVTLGALALPTNLGWMAATIPLAVRGAGLSVYHAPAYTAPLWGVHPQALTIHDVSYERRPEWNAYKDDALRRLFYRRSALAADRIITDSTFSRAEITAAYGIREDRIHVVPLAAAGVFAPGRFESASAPEGVRQPYVLHVGDLHVRRNLATALGSVLELRRHGAPGTGHGPRADVLRAASDVAGAPGALSLVCAGIDRGVGESLAAQAREAGDPGALTLTGSVGEAALANLYRGALALVYPSRYEGFGLPILEAMQSGIPVIGARAASIPEIVEGAGILVDPLDATAWREAIAEVASNPARRAELSDASLRRAADYSWTRTARETLAVFHRCIAAR